VGHDWLGIPFGAALLALMNLWALLGAAVVSQTDRGAVTSGPLPTIRAATAGP
jgi:hypothetical protein